MLVISYADLAANAAGLMIYKDLNAGQFSTNCDYVDSSLDEEKNCNKYSNKMRKIVHGNNRK